MTNNELLLNQTKAENPACARKTVIKRKWLYVFLIPGLLYFFIFNYIPLYGTLIAFQNYDIVKGIFGSGWIGLGHFRTLFHSKEFIGVFINSLLISFYRLAWGFPAPILLAIMLNEVGCITYKRIIQTVLYLPHFISWVVIAGIVSNFLNPSGGLVNVILNEMGIKSIPFIQRPEYFRSIIVISDIWKEAGWGTIVYLAAITSIPADMYEAATIDGAGRLKRILYITLPCLMPTIIVLLVLRMGSLLRNGFEQIFLLYNPLVYQVADVFETFTYRSGLQEGRFDYAAAVGMFQSVVGFILVILTNKLSQKFGEGGLW